jgi:acid stress-induced BolA-like protein IbaG/YrbA
VADLDELKRMIEEALPGAEVEVIDEGGGDHLRANVVATQFEGLSRLDQHRLVKAAVRDRFDDGAIHALSVKTTTPMPPPSSASRPGAGGSE